MWVKDGSYLLFSDPPKNTMYRWSQKDGVCLFLHPSGYAGADTASLREAGSNGLAIDANGALVMCDSGNRALARIDLKTKQKHVFVDRFEGKRFNSPNDLCIAQSARSISPIRLTAWRDLRSRRSRNCRSAASIVGRRTARLR